MSTIDKIIDSFPFLTLPKISSEPNYETISELHTKLNANATFIQTNLGGGTLGHLWLTLRPAVYGTLTDTAFEPPVNPGSQPIILDKQLATGSILKSTVVSSKTSTALN